MSLVQHRKLISSLKEHRTSFDIYMSKNTRKPYQDGSLIFEVHLGDVMDLICPFYDEQESYLLNELEQYDIYHVTKNEFDMCNIDQLNINPTTRILIACNSPYEVMKYTLNFRSYLPIPNGLEFHSNQTYYFLSTTSILSLNQPCYKLKINVHEYQRISSSSTAIPSLDEQERNFPIISHKSNNQITSSADKTIEYNEHHPLFSKIVKAQRHSDPYSIKWITDVPSRFNDFHESYRTANSVSSSKPNTLSLALSASSTTSLSIPFVNLILLILCQL
ncbi:unnamed protein product [Adineta ricciae]|uniref:Ephrin RBD domain-containing protein n=1 Tax=Adineta ricciae TaxID=249248 RepID=A0A813MPZ4_ADIRI|nr:unnamed protein product [Adineta ricciae]